MKTSEPNAIIKKLHENDISARMIYNDPIISKDPKNFPNSIDLIQNSISLPIYPSLSNNEISKIISTLKNKKN